MKRIRDPVAHRIPIYAVPSVISEPEGIGQYHDLKARFYAADAVPDRDLAERLLAGIRGLGKYVPSFTHSPSVPEDQRSVYPQVPDDLSTVLDLVEPVIDFLSQR